MVGRWKFLLGSPIFRGKLLVFRECISPSATAVDHFGMPNSLNHQTFVVLVSRPHTKADSKSVMEEKHTWPGKRVTLTPGVLVTLDGGSSQTTMTKTYNKNELKISHHLIPRGCSSYFSKPWISRNKEPFWRGFPCASLAFWRRSLTNSTWVILRPRLASKWRNLTTFFLGKVTFDPVILCYFRQQNHLQIRIHRKCPQKKLTSKRDTQRQWNSFSQGAILSKLLEMIRSLDRVSHDGSMWLVYLPAWMAWIYGKYR